MFQSAAKDAPALPPPVSYDKLAPHSRSRDGRTQSYPGVRNLFSKELFTPLVSKGGGGRYLRQLEILLKP